MLVRTNVARRSEYAVGVGWVLPGDTDCTVCGWRWIYDKRNPHPENCSNHQVHPDDQPTMD